MNCPSGRTYLLLGLFLQCVATRAASAQQSGAAPLPDDEVASISQQASHSVFLVEGEPQSGLGFLVDTAGLVMTTSELVQENRYLAVTVSPGKKYPASPIAFGPRRIAIIRIHPNAVAGLQPLSIDVTSPESEPLAVGDQILGISTPLDEDPSTSTGVVKKIRSTTLISDIVIAQGHLGSPVLNLRGHVVGIYTTAESNTPSKRHVARISIAGQMLAEARGHLAESALPPFKELPVAPSIPYPAAAFSQLDAAANDPKAHLLSADGITIELLTPPLLHSLALSEQVVLGPPFRTLEDMHRVLRDRIPGRETGMDTPVVTIQVVPEVKRRGWTYLGVASYWTLGAPILFLVEFFSGIISLEEAYGWKVFPVPHVSSRFKPSISEMKLLRGGEEVLPIFPGRECGPMYLGKGKRKRVLGCYGAYTYPPGAFEPGSPMELRIFSEDGSGAPKVITLDPAVVERVWSDFVPYFNAVKKETGSTPLSRAAQDAP